MNIRETFTYFNMAPHIGCIGGNVATAAGADVNRQGFDSLTFLVNVMQTSVMAVSTNASGWFIRMQHTDASALGLGPSTYADCGSIDVIRPVANPMVSGATAAGIVLIIDASGMSGTIQKLGYRGNKQYVRCLLSFTAMTGGASNVIEVMSMLGHAESWPVTVPVLDA
jgi:hypothetical protein